MCRSRRELSNAYLLAKIGVDTAENEPLEGWGKNSIQYSLHPLTLGQGLRCPRLPGFPEDSGGGGDQSEIRQGLLDMLFPFSVGILLRFLWAFQFTKVDQFRLLIFTSQKSTNAFGKGRLSFLCFFVSSQTFLFICVLHV